MPQLTIYINEKQKDYLKRKAFSQNKPGKPKSLSGVVADLIDEKLNEAGIQKMKKGEEE